MPSIFAVGDIHGDAELLANLLAQLEAIAAPEDRFVFLGDYVDRGPDSRGVVEMLVRLDERRPDRCIFLMGNHEQVMVETRYLSNWISWPLHMEGFSTVRSYA